MPKPYDVEPLDAARHDRESFSSGVPALDNYLKRQARQDAQKDLAVPYVLRAAHSPTILGFYTLSTAAIEPAALPVDAARRLPRYPTLPAIRIGRLAVDEHYQGQGLGRLLLIHALRQSLIIAQTIGVLAVVVDAKDAGATRFYEKHGFRHFADRDQNLYLLMATVRQLAEQEPPR